MKARIVLVCISLVFLLLASASLPAQTFRGTILGSVTDPSGAVVAGAKVTVKNVGTGLERTTETSADGSYSLPELPIGTYTVTITQTGFQTFVAKNVTVDVATERRVDAALKAGEVSTRVEVSADRTAAGRDHNQRSGRRAHPERRQGSAHQRARLHQADLLESRRGRFSGSDHGFARFVRRVFHERRPRPLQQLPARRHRHERRLPQRSGHQPGRRVRHALGDSAHRCRFRYACGLEFSAGIWAQRRARWSTS